MAKLFGRLDKMDKKILSFLVVGILIGAAVGVVAGYAVFKKDTGITYWFYIDFGDEEEKASMSNGWVSAVAENPEDAFVKALGNKLEMIDASWGKYINSIGDIKDDYDATGFYWAMYVWSSIDPSDGGWDYSSYGMSSTPGTIFYIWFSDGYEMPADEGDWSASGPFKV